jgi:hypothetical protein
LIVNRFELGAKLDATKQAVIALLGAGQINILDVAHVIRMRYNIGVIVRSGDAVNISIQ